MKNEIKVYGKQNFMGIEIPVIEGGFGENCKCVTFKTISEIHHTPSKEINQSINRLIKKNRLIENIDYIDMFSNNSLKVTANELGLITSNSQKQCYILSERGYTKLIKYMNDDSSWDIMEQLINEYFSICKTIRQSLSVTDLAMLKVMKAKNAQERMIAMKEYNQIVAQPSQCSVEEQTLIGELDESKTSQSNHTNFMNISQKNKDCIEKNNSISNVKIFENNIVDNLKQIEDMITNRYVGFIYILEWDDMVKIGCTTKPCQRFVALKNQAEKYGNVQLGRVAISKEHTNYKKNELKLHQYFQEYRINGTELFKTSMEQVISEIPKCTEFLNESKSIEENNKLIADCVSNYFEWGKYNINSNKY